MVELPRSASRGGREARRSKRGDPGASRAIRAGLTGGQYRPLSKRDIERIHQTVLDVLEKIGMGDAPASIRDLALANGAVVNESGRLCFPRALVEDVIAGAGRNVVLHARAPAHDLDLSGTRVHYGASGVAVLVPDFATGRYRASTITDLYDCARLADVLDNVNFFNRPVIGRDIADPAIHDINMSY